MSTGFESKKHYIITTVFVNMSDRNSAISFITEPQEDTRKNNKFRELVRKEVDRVVGQTGAKFCHLYFFKSSIPFRFAFVFDMGLQDKHFLNKTKLKFPNLHTDIRADDHDYVKRLRDSYEKNSVYEHDGYTAFISD